MRFLALALLLMMVSSCVAEDRKILRDKMNNEAQKPLIHDQKDDAENGGSRLNNHHYIPREDFNDKDGSGGNSGNGGR